MSAKPCSERIDQSLADVVRTKVYAYWGLQSAKVNEVPKSAVESKHVQLVCRPEDSPFYIFKVCSKGFIDEVSDIINKDPSAITLTDKKGWTCLHYACDSNRTKIVDVLLANGADINAKDKDGNTSLHIAVSKGHIETVRHLLIKGADANILNNQLLGPMHVAVSNNMFDVVAEMTKFPKSADINLHGIKGASPLHWAAKNNHWQCAKVLIDAGCKICVFCSNGFTPLHIAARFGASETMELMLAKSGDFIGMAPEQLLSTGDRSSNSPLHTAVSSGDIKAVKMCMDYGARCDVCQENKSTAMHFACAQGILAIVKLMYEMHLKQCGDQIKGKKILQAGDLSQMTPLHKAALFNHYDVVQYLIEQGSNIEALDVDKRTPLLLSAFKKSVDSIRVLVQAGASIYVVDKYGRNMFHYLVLSQSKCCVDAVDELKKLSQSEDGLKLLNGTDTYGCSPLHYASKEGSLKFTETLITLGASVNLKDNGDRSPFHFAAKYGRYNTIKHLLCSQTGLQMLNDIDGEGMTALHVASEHGHNKIVQFLCENGALIHKNYRGLTALHMAAINGHVETMQILLSFHNDLLNQIDENHNNALHFAAQLNQPKVIKFLVEECCENAENKDQKRPLDIAIENRNIEAALAFVNTDKWIEFVVTPSITYGVPVRGFIQLMPEVYKAVLDRCHTKAQNVDPTSSNYWEKFDFSFMQPTLEYLETYKQVDMNYKPLTALNNMVLYGRVELLSHPVSLCYLNMKWRAYGFPVFFSHTFLYLLFVLLLSALVVSIRGNYENFDDTGITFGTLLQNVTITENIIADNHQSIGILKIIYVLFAYLLVNAIKEIFQIYQQRLAYFFDYVNYTEWGLYITTTVFLTRALIDPERIQSVHWQCVSVGIFLAWFNLLLYLERLDQLGLYIIMFRRILQTILVVILVFSVLFVAFALTFYILLKVDKQGGFQTPFLSLVKCLMLMMGDWNFVDMYQKPYLNFPEAGVLMFPELNFVFLFLFVVFIPILFVNLLIGLAVGDIEIVRQEAQLKKLAMQVEYHTKLEPKIPVKILALVDKKEVLIYPNRILQNPGILSNAVSQLLVLMFGSANICPSSLLKMKAEKRAEKDCTIEDDWKKQYKNLEKKLDRLNDMMKMVVQKMEISGQEDFYDN